MTLASIHNPTGSSGPTSRDTRAWMLEKMPLGEEDLNALALLRAEHVKAYLVGKGQLPAERVVVASAVEKLPASRVAFKLQ